jgi:hypothetical protein
MSVDAVDGAGMRSSVQVVVKLNDVNDNTPQFVINNINNNLLNLYSLKNETKFLIGYIEENSERWIEQVRLQAVDRDAELNAKIVYSIASAEFNFADYFDIDNATSLLTLRRGRTLDFEEIYRLKQGSTGRSLDRQLVLSPGEIDLNLIVMAEDMGTPRLSSTINVKIIVKVGRLVYLYLN